VSRSVYIPRVSSYFIFYEVRVIEEQMGRDSGTDMMDYRELIRGCIQKVSGLAAWSENCKWYSSLPLGAVKVKR
jgi:hypothetical protein